MTEGEVTEAFDIIILSCKAYGLAGALDTIAPHVRKGTFILPLLNGYAHLSLLEQRFPSATVLGGSAGIMATLAEDGIVRQMLPIQRITVGSRQGNTDSHGTLEALVAEMKRAGIDASLSTDIDAAMWEKWTILATLAASTCLMRGAVGEVLATDHGKDLIVGLLDECRTTANAEGNPASPSAEQYYRTFLLDPDSTMTASMMRDMDAGYSTEADHILGDMIGRARRHGIKTPLLEVAYARLQVYESQRQL